MDDLQCAIGIDGNGDTSAHRAIRGNKDLETIKRFLVPNCIVHVRNNLGRTVLHEAAKCRSLREVDIFELIFNAGACVNAVDNLGTTALHDVVKNPSCSLKMISYLLKKFAYPSFKDVYGWPPLAYLNQSFLSFYDTQLAEKLLIRYAILGQLMNVNNTDLNEEPILSAQGDEVLCFSYCKNESLRSKYESIRDSHIKEVILMSVDMVDDKYSMLKLIIRKGFKLTMPVLESKAFEHIYSKLFDNVYPLHRKMVKSVMKNYCYLARSLPDLINKS